MRVLQIINSLGIGGAEKLLLDTIPLYRKAGVEMDVLVFWNNNHHFINTLKSLECCKVIVLKESDNYKDIYSVFHILKLRNYLKEYDIAHVHLFPAQYFAVLANISIGNRCKLIFTEHNTTNRRMESSILCHLDRFFYKGYKKIVTITDDVNLVLKKYLKSKISQIITIENGIDIEGVKGAKPYAKEELIPSLKMSDKVLVQVGGFRIQKDQDTTIYSLLHLPANYHLILIGDGERRKQLYNIVLECGLEDRVHFFGLRNDVFSILKSVDFVIVSSHWEGFGLAAVEGMAASIPVIASNVAGLSEVVGGAGVLFEAGNAQELATRIQELLDNKILYDETVKVCRIRASRYDIHKMVNQHIALYKSTYET